jgi:heptosyltransferase-1
MTKLNKGIHIYKGRENAILTEFLEPRLKHGTIRVMQNILLVRLTSMGDIIHNFPAVTDLSQHFPQARIDWLVGRDFVQLPRLHPAIHTVIPCAERQWRKNLFKKQSWQEFKACRNTLKQTPYDIVIDSQGLLKSAWFSRIPKRRSAGYNARSAKEALASYFYTQTYQVSTKLNAIARNRLLTGLACGYTPDTALDYGLPVFAKTLPWLNPAPAIVFVTATSRIDKQWPLTHWITLGQALSQQGFQIVLPWGSTAEQAYCQQLAQHFPAILPPALSLQDAAVMLQTAKLVIGVDTGLTHLAAAVNTPVVMLFCASDPSLTGVQSTQYAVNLGKHHAPACPQEVIKAVEGLF